MRAGVLSCFSEDGKVEGGDVAESMERIPIMSVFV